jgi:hypothetical protein
MERSFYKILGGQHTAMKIVASSPEEHQTDRKCLSSEIPAGMYLDVREGVDGIGANRRPFVMVGLAKIGERLKLDDEESGPVQAEKPAQIPAALEIPKAVQDATDAQLEVMAARNGCLKDGEGRDISAQFRSKPKRLRQAIIAEAMKKQNLVGA